MILYLEPPAFGLPSIDAESIAAVTYCTLVAPDSFSVSYIEAASSLITGHIPALHDSASDIWVSGFTDIVHHLQQLGLIADDNVNEKEHADIMAYSALMAHQAYDLTLFYLYGDDDNYHGYIRNALSAQFSFPNNYTRPNFYQTQALEKADELGLTTTGEEVPQGMFQGQQRTSMLSKARQIRVQDMAHNLYAALESKLSHGPYLCGLKPTSIDCLVFGHLALHMFPEVPNDFLARIIKDSYPRTRKFLVDMNAKISEQRVDIIASQQFSPTRMISSLWREINGRHSTNISSDDSNDLDKTKSKYEWLSKLAFASSTLAVLIGFVLSNKLIVIEVVDDDDEFVDQGGLVVEDDDISDDDDDMD